jgi:hypothetical protein
VRTGRLKKSLIIKRQKDSPKTRPRYFLGPDVKAKAGYAHIIEWGRAANAAGKGAMRGTRFMTAAFERTKSQIFEIWQRTFKAELAARIQKLSTKGGRR